MSQIMGSYSTTELTSVLGLRTVSKRNTCLCAHEKRLEAQPIGGVLDACVGPRSVICSARSTCFAETWATWSTLGTSFTQCSPLTACAE